MPALVRWSPDRRVGIQGILVIVAVEFCQFPLMVDVQDSLEIDIALILVVQLRDQLAQLKLFVVDVHLLQNSFKVEHTDLPISIVIQVLDGTSAEQNIFYG